MASVALIPFVFGCVTGSFLTVVAHRVPRREGFVAGRSRCPECGAQIRALDNVPVLSWLLLHGRCRDCDAPISARYPLAEAGLGALWVATYLILGDDDLGELALGFVLCALLLTITLTDLELKLIPNRLLLPGALAAVAIVALSEPSSLVDRGIAAAIAGGVLFVVAFAYPRGMGMGDVKLAAVMGLYLGRAVAPALLIGFLAGALVGVAMIARQGSGARKQAIPFGPFLALGGVIGLWYGDQIVDWYLNEFFPES